MRIDYLITGLDIGGAEFQVVALAEKMVQKGHQVRVISLLPPKAFVERLEKSNVDLCSLDITSSFHFPFAIIRLIDLLKRNRPDILHAHMVHANILARLVRFFYDKTKVITTVHSIYEGGKIRDWIYRLTKNLSHLNTTVSDSATRRFVNEKIFNENSTRTVYNGIDINKYISRDKTAVRRKEFSWIAVGRLVKDKDYPTLLNAMVLLNGSKLAIVGEGDLRPDLLKLIDQLRLKDRVELLGSRTDVDKLYHLADGFVLSSECEGYGLVVAEAMASQLPVVVTNSGGPGEIVGREQEAGLIVPIHNPELLASAMREIENMSNQERFKMGAIGRERIIQYFSLSGICEQWENIYKEVLGF